MIFTNCPKCDEIYTTPMDAEECATARYWWERVKCSECGAVFWVEHTRTGGYTLNEVEFYETFVTDHESKSVRVREDTAQGKAWTMMDEERTRVWENLLSVMDE